MGIGAVAIAGGMTLSQYELKMVKSVRESNAASHALEERIEQLRLVNWRQMTDAADLLAHYMPNQPQSGRSLPGLTERLTVTPYPDKTVCAPLMIERDANGTSRIVAAGAELGAQRLARVNARVSWMGKDGKMRVRELASIISNAGINATSLPGMGAQSGSTGDSNTSTTTATPTASTTSGSTSTTTSTAPSSTTTTTSTPTTTAPTTTTTVTTNNSQGQGNVAGKSGKK